MFEPGMDGGRIDQIRGPQLLDSAQPLEFRRIHEFHFERTHLDVAMDGVAD